MLSESSANIIGPSGSNLSAFYLYRATNVSISGIPYYAHAYSAIHKAIGWWLEQPPEVVPATSSIQGLWEFQELYQAKSWNGREP